MFLAAAFAFSAKADCPSDPMDLFRAKIAVKEVFQCKAGEESTLCSRPTGAVCQRIPVIDNPVFSIQTGKYAQITASRQALNSKCMTTIVQAAYKLHAAFPDYNFVIDSHIHNCQNLSDGIKHLLADVSRVKRNLDRFHTPLHSVFLSNRSGFNNQDLGKMGLYINVDRDGEIARVLINSDLALISTSRKVSRL